MKLSLVHRHFSPDKDVASKAPRSVTTTRVHSRLPHYATSTNILATATKSRAYIAYVFFSPDLHEPIEIGSRKCNETTTMTQRRGLPRR
jgi:hypothetical protein